MQSGKAAAPPMSVTNSRHCIAALNPPIAPYHVIAENAACITAKLAGDVRDGVNAVRFRPSKFFPVCASKQTRSSASKQPSYMMDGMTDRPTKISFGDMRESGVRGILVYCAD